MSTLVLTQSYNPQSITWDVAGALWSMVRSLALLLVIGCGLLAVFAAIAMIPPTFWIGLAVVAAYAVVMMPRKKVQP